MRVLFVAQPAGRPPVTFTVDADRTASGRGAKGLPIWTELGTHKCDGCAWGGGA